MHEYVYGNDTGDNSPEFTTKEEGEKRVVVKFVERVDAKAGKEDERKVVLVGQTKYDLT